MSYFWGHSIQTHRPGRWITNSCDHPAIPNNRLAGSIVTSIVPQSNVQRQSQAKLLMGNDSMRATV